MLDRLSSRRWLLGWLVLLTLLVWAPSLRNSFAFDDVLLIVRSPRLHSWGALLSSFRHPCWWAAEDDIGQVGTYRPLMLASFVIDYQLWGLRAFGYHLTSVLLHAAVQVAAFLFLSCWVPLRVAFALAALAALHPANVESITWIAGRSEVFVALFGLLALAEASRAPLPPRRAGVLGLCLLGALLGKESAAIFVPLTLALSELARRTREPRPAPRALLPVWIATGAAALVYAALRTAALGRSTVPHHASLAAMAAAVPTIWYLATQAFFVPINRALALIDLGAASLAERTLWIAVGGFFAVLLLLMVRARRLLEAVGLSWWLGALTPAAAILLTDGAWPGLNRWLYVGTPGLLLAMYLGLRERVSPRALQVTWLLLCLCYVPLAERAIAAWQDDVTLFTATAEESPQHFYGYRRLAFTLYWQGRFAQAEPIARRATELAPPDERESCFGVLAAVLAGEGQCDQAVALYRGHLPTGMMPVPDFALAAGACYEAAGRKDRARVVYGVCGPDSRCLDRLRQLGGR